MRSSTTTRVMASVRSPATTSIVAPQRSQVSAAAGAAATSRKVNRKDRGKHVRIGGLRSWWAIAAADSESAGAGDDQAIQQGAGAWIRTVETALCAKPAADAKPVTG